MTAAHPTAPSHTGFSVRQYAICLIGIVWRESLRFLHQRERFIAALVRPLLWLFIFAAGFRQVLGVSIIPPYETYVLYEVYITPGLVAMILLFNGMQSSLSMVYDREMGNMRTLLVSPFPRWYLLISKLVAGIAVSILQVYVFLAIAWLWEVEPPPIGYLGHPAGAYPVRASVRIDWPAAVIAHQAAREFCRDHELRHLPDVFRLIGSLSLVEGQGIEPAALLCLPVEPVHARCRAHPLLAARQDELDGACHCGCNNRRFPDRRHHCLRSDAGLDRQAWWTGRLGMTRCSPWPRLAVTAALTLLAAENGRGCRVGRLAVRSTQGAGNLARRHMAWAAT